LRHQEESGPLARTRREWSFVAIALCLVGCAAREVTPVAMAQPGDDQLDCPALIEQIKANRAAADEFLASDKRVAEGNVAKTVAGTIFAPIGVLLAAASIDLSNEEQVKARSIADRNERLIYLAKAKGCAET
jgi:hypothetical protein